MRAVSIFRDKYRQSYYNDKHEDAAVIEDRARYIQVMDRLSLRQPLWLQLPWHEYWVIKDRMPADPLLVHQYEANGARMVEVHVDLDDSFDSRRAVLPLGGQFSIRFPGTTPLATALRTPPPGLPPPGSGLTPLRSAAAEDATEGPGANVVAPATACPATAMPSLPTLSAISKMKVIDLRGQLLALGVNTDGLRPELQARLRSAVLERSQTSEATTSGGNDEEEGEEWAVKRILGRRTCTHIVNELCFDTVEYQVEWDYPDERDPSKCEVTWEGEANLTHAIEAMYEFLASQPKEKDCVFNHVKGVCRCALPLIHV